MHGVCSRRGAAPGGRAPTYVAGRGRTRGVVAWRSACLEGEHGSQQLPQAQGHPFAVLLPSCPCSIRPSRSRPVDHGQQFLPFHLSPRTRRTGRPPLPEHRCHGQAWRIDWAPAAVASARRLMAWACPFARTLCTLFGTKYELQPSYWVTAARSSDHTPNVASQSALHTHAAEARAERALVSALHMTTSSRSGSMPPCPLPLLLTCAHRATSLRAVSATRSAAFRRQLALAGHQPLALDGHL